MSDNNSNNGDNDESGEDDLSLYSAGAEQSDDDDDVESCFQEEEESQQSLSARDHTYLPGTSHPLWSESMKNADRKNKISELLPILELPGVVIFPGMTIPIRLRHPRWIEYLGKQIDKSRHSVASEIRIGVITQIVNQTVRQTRRRQSWMRTAMDLQRSQNASQQLLLSLLNDDNDDQSNNDSDQNDDNLRASNSSITQRQQEAPPSRPKDPLMGRIGTTVTVTYTHGDSTLESGGDSGTVWTEHRNASQLVVTAVGTYVKQYSVCNRMIYDPYTFFVCYSIRLPIQWSLPHRG